MNKEKSIEMNREEAIKQLKDLIEDRKAFCAGDYDSIFDKDIEALKYAIRELEKTALEVPVQEQLMCEYLGCSNKLILDDVEVSPGVIEKKYVCQKHLGELNNNILITSNIKK